MTIAEKLARLKGLKRDLYDYAKAAIQFTHEDLLDLNKSQMKKGEKSNGESIGRYSWQWYANVKFKMNTEAGGNIDLEYTGKFKRAMSLRFLNDKTYLIFSKDSKEAELKKFGWWDDDIYGLNQSNLQIYRGEFFYPALMQRVRKQVNG